MNLSDLTPGDLYHFDVFASNGVQQNVDSGDNTFSTDQQVTGVAGTQVTVTDSGTSYTCPTQGDTPVDWGDDFSDTNAQIQCQEGPDDETDYTLTDTHTYAGPGHYLIQISYGDLGTTTDEYAQISGNDSGLTNTEPPVISGTAEQGQTLTTTNGMWNGGVEAYGYQWLDCDVSGQNCTDTGDSAPSYTLTADDVGDTIRVIVFASNDGGEVGAISDSTDVVQQSEPPGNDTPR